jgi:hypothetical protein
VGLYPRVHHPQNRIRHPFGILHHIAVPIPHHDPPLGLEERRPPRVIALRQRMLVAIKLDRYPRSPAGEIDDVRPDHQLPSEARAIARQQPPQYALRPGAFIAKVARVTGQAFGNAAHGVEASAGRCAVKIVITAVCHPLPAREGRLSEAERGWVTLVKRER